MPRGYREPERPEVRFRRFVEKTDGCWLWKGSVGPGGYGRFLMGSRIDGSRRVEKASRASWLIHRGEIPNGMCVCHVCDVPSCVNPDHLFLGTHKDNMVDMCRKGRHGRYGRKVK